MYSSLLMGLFLVVIVEWSYWGSFGTYIWEAIIFLKILNLLVSAIVERQLGESLLSQPLMTSMGLVQSIVTLSANDFMDFLLSYIVEFGFVIIERMYTDPYQGMALDWIYDCCSKLAVFLKAKATRIISKKANDEAPKNDAAETDGNLNVTAENSDTVEPILDSYGSYCCDTLSLFYTPYIIFILLVFRDETEIPILYSIKNSDMEYYLIFALVIIPFQISTDIFIHSSLELFHGWKIHDYLVYAKYRFRQRESRWKGLEDSLDECIDESMRTLDQMCFSSQFYMMMTIQVNGIIYLVLGTEMMVRAKYNLFGDPAMPVLAAFVILCSFVVKRLLLLIALVFNVWRIRHENTAWHANIRREDDIEIPNWEDIRGASHDAYAMNQRISSETFRYKFLNYNRSWLIDQLPNMLTPRTMRRSRPYLINQFTRILNSVNRDISSDSDDDVRTFEIPPLNAPTRKMLRWWLRQAQRRLKLRKVVQPLIQHARGGHCERCLSRKLLKVKTKVGMEEMDRRFRVEYPGEEAFDQVLWKHFWQKHQRYETICLPCIGQTKERERKAAMAGDQSDDLRTDAGASPEWGAVSLDNVSKAILMGWYKSAQENVFGQGGRRRNQSPIDISDDEEEDEVSFSWAQRPVNINEPSKAIAIKWLRTARSHVTR